MNQVGAASWQILRGLKKTHIWMTNASLNKEELYLPRKLVLRMYWDGEEEPSVEVPLGDFFGLGHGITKTIPQLH